MANMFEKYAADREVEQKKIEKAVVADTMADENCRNHPRVDSGAS